jgi:hypothetical protein
VQCILFRTIIPIPRFAAFRGSFVCGLWNPNALKLIEKAKCRAGRAKANAGGREAARSID